MVTRSFARNLAMSLLLIGASVADASAQAPRVNEDARALKDFANLVQKYQELHRRLDTSAPKIHGSSNPEEIAAHQEGLARLIRGARRNAREGDVFTAPIRRVFRKIIQSYSDGRDADLEALLSEESPIIMRLTVNDSYPGAAPLVTVPAKLLQELPPLPEELAYRFVGRDLTLLDAEANLVVDRIQKILR